MVECTNNFKIDHEIVLGPVSTLSALSCLALESYSALETLLIYFGMRQRANPRPPTPNGDRTLLLASLFNTLPHKSVQSHCNAVEEPELEGNPCMLLPGYHADLYRKRARGHIRVNINRAGTGHWGEIRRS